MKYVLGTGEYREKYKDAPKSNKKKTLLITGGAGFLGYHLSQRLRDKYNMVFLDIADFNVKEYPKGSFLYKADVRNKRALSKIFKEHKIDYVIHAAAALPLWKKEDIFSTNVKGTKNVFDLSQKYADRALFVSSTAVYGVPKVHPLYEDSSELIGVGAYGESKIEAEKIVLKYRKEGFFSSIIRPKTFIGTARLGVFQILYDWVESGVKIPVIGNGKNRYQLLEVDDLVDAMDLAISSKKGNDTFNVGAEEFGTVDEDLTALCEYAGTGARVMHTPAFAVKSILAVLEAFNLSPLYKWVYGTADKDSFVSVDKIKKALKWKAKYSNKDALIRSYKWYLDNKDKLDEDSGVTHRIRWKQGALAIVKKFM